MSGWDDEDEYMDIPAEPARTGASASVRSSSTPPAVTVAGGGMRVAPGALQVPGLQDLDAGNRDLGATVTHMMQLRPGDIGDAVFARPPVVEPPSSVSRARARLQVAPEPRLQASAVHPEAGRVGALVALFEPPAATVHDPVADAAYTIRGPPIMHQAVERMTGAGVPAQPATAGEPHTVPYLRGNLVAGVIKRAAAGVRNTISRTGSGVAPVVREFQKMRLSGARYEREVQAAGDVLGERAFRPQLQGDLASRMRLGGSVVTGAMSAALAGAPEAAMAAGFSPPPPSPSAGGILSAAAALSASGSPESILCGLLASDILLHVLRRDDCLKGVLAGAGTRALALGLGEDGLLKEAGDVLKEKMRVYVSGQDGASPPRAEERRGWTSAAITQPGMLPDGGPEAVADFFQSMMQPVAGLTRGSAANYSREARSQEALRVHLPRRRRQG
eukprot:CAMPEP_0206233860 /NCGR_PEP_ID=MMETSP0047_2-20121206/12250_1 /ASSEMBLY_ACC=CAM_ASM_000192 /TAXON_ID=195065 /ORGANISM="Chroomonas mesostigmatica_cf, Strain CCMP1168" /LENGTH=445 /DNA_ID=CAMNT_0053657843 /DNA_START=156 /DNA_END=1490 /DNA_ORIENTATION=+